MGSFKVSEQWRLFQVGNTLHIVGGQDAIYTIELAESEESFFGLGISCFSREELKDSDKIICEQLLSANIVHPILSLEDENSAVIGIFGDSLAVDSFQLKEQEYVTEQSECEIGILVRATSSLDEFLKLVDYENITIPHLFVDLAFHHTISLGPLVFPGQSSCVFCLSSRIKNRWENDHPPIAPRVLDSLASLAKGLTQTYLNSMVASDNFLLINNTIAFNTDTFESVKYSLSTLPQCIYCNRDRLIDNNGKVDLAWRGKGNAQTT